MSHQENSPISITPGAIRFNTDSMKLEYFRIGMEAEGTASYAGIGTLASGEWVQITTDTPDIQTGGTRGIFSGGEAPTTTDVIQYVTISTTGDAIDFGDLPAARTEISGGIASRTLGYQASSNPSATAISYVTFSSTGDATSFGSLSTSFFDRMGCSNSTRGIVAGGQAPSPATNSIEYFTLTTSGSGVDFGDLNATTNSLNNGCASTTRGVFAGYVEPTFTNRIEFITISTLGNASDFGDTTYTSRYSASCSNAIRGLHAGGSLTASPATYSDTIEFFTIATLGNAQDFGDLTAARGGLGACSSPTRGVFSGGYNPTRTDTIDYVQIMSTGNAVDFGNLLAATQYPSGCSNGHGGLG